MYVACIAWTLAIILLAYYYEESLQENRLLVVVMTKWGHTTGQVQRTLNSVRSVLPLSRIFTCRAPHRQLCLQQALSPAPMEDYVLMLEAGLVIERRSRPTRISAAANTLRVGGVVDYTDKLLLVSTRALRSGTCYYRGLAADDVECGGGSSHRYSSFDLFDPDAGAFTQADEDQLQALLHWFSETPDAPAANATDAHFQAGQLLERKGDLLEANAHYVKQLELGETRVNYRYYAQYSRARIAVRLNHSHEEAKQLFLTAYAYGGEEGLSRWEPRYYLARMERAAGHYALCILYAGDFDANFEEDYAAKLAPFHPLRVEHNIYAWAMEEELAYCLHRAGHEQEAQRHREHAMKSKAQTHK